MDNPIRKNFELNYIRFKRNDYDKLANASETLIFFYANYVNL